MSFSNGRRNQEIFHQWAHQVERGGDVAGKTKDGRVFYVGRCIFSYGLHYVAGYVMPSLGAVLLNATKYSPTTTQHVFAAGTSASHLHHIWVPNLTRLVSTPGQDWRLLEAPESAEIIKAHVRDNALDYSRGSAEYLLGLAGSKSPVEDFQSILAVAAQEKREADERWDQEKRTRLTKKAQAFADMPDGTFHEQLAAYGHGRAGWDAFAGYQRTLPAVRTHVHRLLKAYQTVHGGRGSPTTLATLKARYAHIRAFVQGHAFRAEKKAEKERWGLAAQHIRDALAEPEGELVRNWLNATIESCNHVLLHKRRGLIPRLTTIGELQTRLVTREDEIKAKEQEKQEARLKEALDAWLKSQTPSLPYRLHALRPTRIRAFGGKLETTQGASVPMADALRLFPLLKRCRSRGEGWTPAGLSGLKAGPYAINRIDADGSFQAGCHLIVWSEVERLAKELEVFEL